MTSVTMKEVLTVSGPGDLTAAPAGIPGVAISAVVSAVNLLGDGLRDALE